MSHDDGEDDTESDLTDLEQRAVGYIREHGPSSTTDLVEDYGSDSIRKALINLADRGVVEKRKDPDDGRRYLYSLPDSEDAVQDDEQETGGETGAQDGDADGSESDGVWCGVCGDGPFASGRQFAGHHAGAGHDGATEPVAAPPVADGGERASNADEPGLEDDVTTGWEFECPVCDKPFDTETELSHHRSKGRCVALPDHVSEADLEEIVAEADILLEVQRELRVNRKQARGLLKRFDLADQLDAKVGRPAKTPDTDAVLEDGGPMAGETSASAICQNCGSQVTAQYARVFAPDGDPRVCPECEDKTRTPDGTVRDRRDKGQHLGSDGV